MIFERMLHTTAKPALAWGLAIGALAMLTWAQAAAAPLMGLWIDELYSLWASDPGVSAGESLARITGDSNPPLYFALLRAVRALVGAPHAAILALNGLALLATAALLLRTTQRTGLTLAALAALALSGPVFFYFQEGRAYFIGLCLAFALSWLAALALGEDGARARPRLFATLGVLSALTHVYTALFAGCLAAGLVAHGLLSKRKELREAGFALGFATVAAFALWLASAYGRLGNVAWIEFSNASVREAFWYVRSLAVGPGLMLAPLALILGIGAVALPRARPLFVAFGVTAVLFVALPLAASLKTPIINGRYWLIGAPALIVVLVMLAREFARERRRWASVATIALLAATAAAGFVQSRNFLRSEPVWRGAARVRALAADCPDGGIRVAGAPSFLYAQASGLPESRFAQAAEATHSDACPVLGWFEHVRRAEGDVLSASDQDLLAELGISADPAGVRIERWPSGYLVLRSDD